MRHIATIVPALASAAAMLIAALKPTGIEEAQKGYEIVRQELVIQHEEMLKMNKSLVELQAWLKVMRQHELGMMEYYVKPKFGVTLPDRGPASLPTKGLVSSLVSDKRHGDLDGILVASDPEPFEALPPVPDVPASIVSPLLPTAEEVFGKKK
jgi:hypothetical protein